MSNARTVLEVLGLGAAIATAYYTYKQGELNGRETERSSTVSEISLMETTSRYVAEMGGYASLDGGRIEKYSVVAGKHDRDKASMGEINRLLPNSAVIGTVVQLASTPDSGSTIGRRFRSIVITPLEAYADSYDPTVAGGALIARAKISAKHEDSRVQVDAFDKSSFQFLDITNVDLRNFKLNSSDFRQSFLTRVQFNSDLITGGNLERSTIDCVSISGRPTTEDGFRVSDGSRTRFEGARIRSSKECFKKLAQLDIEGFSGPLDFTAISAVDESGKRLPELNAAIRIRGGENDGTTFERAGSTTPALISFICENSRMNRAIFSNASLRDFTVTGCSFRHSRFGNGVNIGKALISNSDNSRSDFSYATFDNGALRNASIVKTTAIGANLVNADIDWKSGVSEFEISGAFLPVSLVSSELKEYFNEKKIVVPPGKGFFLSTREGDVVRVMKTVRENGGRLMEPNPGPAAAIEYLCQEPELLSEYGVKIENNCETEVVDKLRLVGIIL